MNTVKVTTIDQAALNAHVRTIVRQHVDTSNLTAPQIAEVLDAIEAGVVAGVTMGYDLAAAVFSAMNTSPKQAEFRPSPGSN